jgi:WD40 repeat protein
MGKCKVTGELIGHKNGVWCMDINDNKQLLASSGSDGEVLLWDCKSNKMEGKIKFE